MVQNENGEMINQIISLFSSQFSNFPNHKSSELELVVKRVNLVFLFDLLLLFICQPTRVLFDQNLLLQKHVRLTSFRDFYIVECSW